MGRPTKAVQLDKEQLEDIIGGLGQQLRSLAALHSFAEHVWEHNNGHHLAWMAMETADKAMEDCVELRKIVRLFRSRHLPGGREWEGDDVSTDGVS